MLKNWKKTKEHIIVVNNYVTDGIENFQLIENLDTLMRLSDRDPNAKVFLEKLRYLFEL